MFAPSLFRRSILRTFQPPVRNPFVNLQKRSYHERPMLYHESRFSKEGIPGLFSPQGFNTAWTEYQEGLIKKLNSLTAGHEIADKSAFEISILTSRQADLAATFNYASQAHNNHFFFDALSPTQTELPDRILGYIPDTFSSPEAMKTEVLATAEAMFGSGWVWLVLDMNKRLRILCTYNAGSPYGQAHRRQEIDMNTTNKPQRNVEYSIATARANKPYGTQEFIPLLNINCWEHAWITDHGVRGKSDYLEILWNRIDWEKVDSRIGILRTRTLL